ncbi:MAG: DUF4838 domain-containing protein [Bacteroidales bacterium]
MNKILARLLLLFALTTGSIYAAGSDVTALVKNGKANYIIVTPAKASECERFAARELKQFLFGMSKADFEISDKIIPKSIVVSALVSLPESLKTVNIRTLSCDAYAIIKQRETIYLVGETPRATLYAVYDFLNKLGCQWVAPDFDFFENSGRIVPSKNDLAFVYEGDKTETPVFKYRKLYVEEGKTHTLQNLKQLVDWMPKMKYNTLVIPINYQGHGKVKWENWRKKLTPELRKRGIIVEVGGHGYQNFVNATMEDGKLYKKHPEWFGMDKTGVRSKEERMVICTSNADAVDYLNKHVLTWLKSHPEIDILDFWPPDGELWCQCEACMAMGSETDRHAMLVNQMAALLQKEMPHVVLECLAYSRYIAPTQNITLNNKVLLDFCPINQCFEYQIYEDGDARNKAYNDDLIKWTKAFGGDISIYSYFRKYGWRSLPNIIPHFMQRELNYYHSIGMKGISVYSEPGDWFTYGVNHYVLAHLAWNPNVNVDSLVEAYSAQIYRKAAPVGVFVYNELEGIVRFACSIPYTTLKKPEQYDVYAARIAVCRQKVTKALGENRTDLLACKNLKRLGLMLEYANKSLEVMRSKTLENKEETTRLEAEVKSYVKGHAEEGVFIP